MGVSITNMTLENIIEQALKIPGVKVNREEFLTSTFTGQGILLRQIIAEGPVACDFSEIELDVIAERLILRRTSESSAMSFAAGIPGGLAMAATIPADTLQFFAMSLRMAQELAYLYGAKDFFGTEGDDTTFARYQLICSLGAMYGIEGAAAGTRLLSSHLALRATGGTPAKATTKAFWEPIVKRISKELAVRLTTDTASKGFAKIFPIVGGLFSGGLTFLSMRPMGQKLASVLNETSFRYSDSYAMKDFVTLDDISEKAAAEQMDEPKEADESWGAMNPETGETVKTAAPEKPAEDGGTAIPVSIDGEAPAKEEEIPVSSAEEKAEEKPAEEKMTTDEVFALIEKLAGLRDKGAITEEDYNRKKEELLARI
ncbi:MAG: SHOCT domain-containing protein [Lachnospiraceae bacterium]|nr:SHOCT domain-containing protein [Lachnospiraceae bacterium]